MTGVARTLAIVAAALPAAARAQGEVVTPASGWPIAWLLFFFAVAALLGVVLFVVFAIRWRGDPPRPGRPR